MYYRSMPRAAIAWKAAASGMLVVAIYWSLRLAYADYLFRSGTEQGIEEAARLVPGNPTYALRTGKLKRALELNPYLSAAWLELAHGAEASGDEAAAEAHFLKAARVDQTFEPRWALANYYFRRGREEEFWRWMRLAAERSYGDRTGLFRLAWRFTGDSRLILERGIVPSAEFLGLYVDFLASERKWEAAVEAAAALAGKAGPAEKARLLDLCEALLKEKQTGLALRAWNLWDPGHALDAGGGRSLTNADLSAEPLGKGFGWRMPWRSGTAHWYSAASREIRITLDGRQYENTELLEQYVPVVPGAGYRFKYGFRGSRLSKQPGLRWRAVCVEEDRILAESAPMESAEEVTAGAFEFVAAAGCGVVKLTLFYRRVPGTVRPEGDIFMVSPFALVRTR